MASRLTPAALVSRALMTVALLVASLAWAGFVFQRTVGDPRRATHVATAVLDDPTARAELAKDLVAVVGPAAQAAGLPAGDPRLTSVVEGMLGDPRLTGAVVQAVAAAHATALGDRPLAPPTVDGAVLTAVLRDRLATIDPRLAAAVPALPAGTLELPAVTVPGLGTARDVVDEALAPLTAVAVVAGLAAFALGDRGRVLRRAGAWAVGAGIAWAVLPRAVVWIAEQLADSHVATVRAVVEAASSGVTGVAVGLVVLGVGGWWGGVVWDRFPRSGAFAR